MSGSDKCYDKDQYGNHIIKREQGRGEKLRWIESQRPSVDT